MTYEAMRNGNKQHFENLLFIIFKKGTPRKRAGVRTPWTPLDPPPDYRNVLSRVRKVARDGTDVTSVIFEPPGAGGLALQ